MSEHLAWNSAGRRATEVLNDDPSTHDDASRALTGALAPGTRIANHEIIRPLGKGGMGEVYLARDIELDRLVAVKLLVQQRAEHMASFLVEARATARCQHENIVVIHEVGEYQGRPYMVLEYLEGQTLWQWLREHAAATAAPGQRAPVPPGYAVELMMPVVRALAYAHERGIVHRDLKPENILLTRTGTVKVLDFGLAKLLSAPDEGSGGSAGIVEVRSSALAGTLPYMSPEQMRVGAIDHRSDLWAVGIILFELVTGVHPVPSRAMDDLLGIAHESTAMPSVREHRRDLGPLADIIDRCLLKDKEHRTATARELLQELEALLPAQRRHVRDEDGNPFGGLAAFQEADADRFFGRNQDITSLIYKLRNLPLVAVTGPSGAGKSSLVRAGVIPALKRSGEGWEALVMRPGHQPLTALAEVLLAVSVRSSEIPTGRGITRSVDQVPDDRNAIIAHLRTEPGYLCIALRTWARAKLRRVVLFVDQFEELYTLGADVEERTCVLACLSAVADDVTSPLRIILSLRSDFLDRLAEQRAFLDAVSHGLTFLSPLDRGGLREALTRPVEARDHRFESPEMVEHILDELATTRSPLPLLQFTGDKLWARRDRQQRMLTESSLRALGGVSGALTSHADAILASMPAHDVRFARAVFLRLVTPERTRALATMAELRQLGGDAESMNRVLTRLIDARLLAVEGSSANASGSGESDITVEIVHESLIDTWPLLGQWLIKSEGDAIFLARLRGAAKDWERSGHAAGLLWTGAAADEARAWHQRYQGELAPTERRYLEAVIVATERARLVRRRLFGGILLAAVVIAIAMSWLAWEATTLARQEIVIRQKAAQEAVRARDATRMAAMQAFPGDPTTQLALLREIEDTSAPPPGAAQQAKRLLHASVAAAVFTSHDDSVQSAAFSPDGERIISASMDKTVRVWNADGHGEPVVLRGHDDTVMSAAFSPDGRRIVSASEDKTMRVWSADGHGEPVVLRGHDDTVMSAAFSPDGQRIVSASTDKTIRVWNANGSSEPLVLRGHDDAVWSVAFSPDGQRVVSASWDKTVRVWNANGSSEPLVLRGHDDRAVSAAFSPDGQRIVSASADKTIRVWNADGSGAPLVLRGHDDVVWSVAFRSDGQRIVSASWDKTVRVWNANGSGEPLVLRGHGDSVFSVTFSPDGQRIVSASWDKTVRVWNANGSSEPLVLRGHDNGVWSAAFSPNGQRIVSASWDKTVRVWNANGSGEPLALRGHDDRIFSVAFSPDGTRIVSASLDKTIRVWSADGSGEPLVLRGHGDSVWSVAFSPDGQRIVSASWDKTVRVWNADGSGEPLILRSHDHKVQSAAFSPDGRRIVSASLDKTVRVWNADGSGEPLVLRGHDHEVYSATFSPDGRRIVSASLDKTVRVWNADGSGEPVVLHGHDDWVSGAEFSPDGKYIVSASRDKTIRIWRADGTGEPIILVGHDLWVNKARFSPDGRRIVSASEDKTIRVWHDLAPARLDDPRLWTATTYCMSVERRKELLGVTEEMARRDRQRCLKRVEQARHAEQGGHGSDATPVLPGSSIEGDFL